MDKKDFIFPGVILGIVIIVGLGLLLTHGSTPPLISNNAAATSTPDAMATTTPDTGSTTPVTPVHSSPAPTAYYPYGTITLALDQPAVFKDGLSIRPVTVTEDSRCPMGVQCIQAGTVKLSLRVNTGNGPKIETIQLGQSVTVGTDTITLDSVSPSHPKSNTILPSSYRFTFILSHGGISAAPCYVGGCSAELCTDSPGAVSPCLYHPSYGCYKSATCERQSNGSCGWTETAALKACLANPPQQ